jgi:hypothetical protein
MNGTEIFGHLPGRTNENKKFLSAASRRRNIRKVNNESKRQVCLYWLAMCNVYVIYKAWVSQTSGETNCGLPIYDTPWSSNWVAEFWRNTLASLLSSVNFIISLVLAFWTDYTVSYLRSHNNVPHHRENIRSYEWGSSWFLLESIYQNFIIIAWGF